MENFVSHHATQNQSLIAEVQQLTALLESGSSRGMVAHDVTEGRGKLTQPHSDSRPIVAAKDGAGAHAQRAPNRGCEADQR
jgi:hypothetical protein